MADETSLDGKLVKIEAGMATVAEKIFYYKRALDRLFTRFIAETKDCVIKENNMWEKLKVIAKQQYPDFDETKYVLNYDFINHGLFILNKDTAKGTYIS